MTAIDRHVGTNLRSRRLRIGKTPAQVAEAVGLEPEDLQGIEDGRRRASAEHLLAFCTVLRMRPADIYQGLIA